MAKDRRLILNFKTLANFNKQLAATDGPIDESKHLVFIQDSKQIWWRGAFYADNTKLDNLNTVYNSVSYSQKDGTTNTITLSGVTWNATTRTWDAVSKTITLVSATTSKAGLMSADDKTEFDRIVTANYAVSAVTPDTTKIAITAASLNIDTNASVDDSWTIPAVTESKAGVMSALDKTKINDVDISDFSFADTTYAASKVTINSTKTRVATSAGGAKTTTSPSTEISAATTSQAGVMSADDKTELDRIITANYAVSAVTPDTTKISITAASLNIDTNASVDDSWTIPAATEAKAGALSALDKTKLNDVVISNYDMEAPTHNASTVVLNGKRTKVATAAGGATSTEEDDVTINAATESTAGVMTSLDKTKMNDVVISNYAASEPTHNTTSVILNNTRTKVATASGGATSTEANNVTIKAASTSAAGVMTTTQVTNLNTVKSYYDFVTGFSTVTSITSIPITYRNVEATISAGATIGVASVPAKGRELHVIIKNSGSANITVNLPNTGNYICTNEDKFIEIYPGLYGEVHLLSNGSKVYVRGVGQ